MTFTSVRSSCGIFLIPASHIKLPTYSVLLNAVVLFHNFFIKITFYNVQRAKIRPITPWFSAVQCARVSGSENQWWTRDPGFHNTRKLCVPYVQLCDKSCFAHLPTKLLSSSVHEAARFLEHCALAAVSWDMSCSTFSDVISDRWSMLAGTGVLSVLWGSVKQPLVALSTQNILNTVLLYTATWETVVLVSHLVCFTLPLQLSFLVISYLNKIYTATCRKLHVAQVQVQVCKWHNNTLYSKSPISLLFLTQWI